MGGIERSSVGPQPAPTKDLPGRRHPARLPDPLYREPYAVASVTVCGRQGVLLTSTGIPDAIVPAMLDVARRHGVRVHGERGGGSVPPGVQCSSGCTGAPMRPQSQQYR
jgi:hypothetical protein